MSGNINFSKKEILPMIGFKRVKTIAMEHKQINNIKKKPNSPKTNQKSEVKQNYTPKINNL